MPLQRGPIYHDITQHCDHSCRTWIRLETHNRYPIPRPNGRAMGCLLWRYWRKWPRFNGTALYSSILILDVDECATENGGCNQVCDNTLGNYTCSCNIPGFEVGEDGHTCYGEQAADTLRNNDVAITSFWRNYVKMTSYWRYNDVIIMSYVQWAHTPWWRHRMETFPHYWPFVRGIHRSSVDSPYKASDAGLWCFLWSALE